MDNSTSILQPFYFETLADESNICKFLEEHWHYSLYWSLIYVFTIFTTKYYMKNRPAFDLRVPLFLWNLGLAIVCILATLRMIPALYYIIRKFGFTSSLCDMSTMLRIQPSVFWMWSFLCFKVIELGDTLFIVLRKRKLIFLHWYHHSVTCIMAWYLAGQLAAVGHWFAVMNYAVHSLMYLYYALRVLGMRLRKEIAMSLMILEIIQLIVGALASCWAILTKYQGEACSFSDQAIIVSICVYSSYILLFSRLFYTSFLSRRLHKVTEEKAD